MSAPDNSELWARMAASWRWARRLRRSQFFDSSVSSDPQHKRLVTPLRGGSRQSSGASGKKGIMNNVRAWGIAFLLISLPACVAIPIPVPERKALAGRQITTEMTAFIQPGVTTRADVIRELGEPYQELTAQRIFAYRWEMLTMYVPWALGGRGGAVGGVEEIGKPYLLLIAFNPEDRVVKFEASPQKPWDTVQEHAVKWA